MQHIGSQSSRGEAWREGDWGVNRRWRGTGGEGKQWAGVGDRVRTACAEACTAGGVEWTGRPGALTVRT